ncbi:hypothetical protein D9758_005582 [Tetrapyrgos nigripes]|uniref:Uncharacterized protein n=1 Tax=Tetrapyrgos nigripes TaxID=182062 RepID=A0A8H5GGH6_9AGAR|nr:hypothetical protein D9758_005582 [Tetrapyrgos nigripes]
MDRAIMGECFLELNILCFTESTLQCIVFSHPGNAFPTDLAEVARRLPEIEKRQIKIIGVSRNWVEDSKQWTASQQMYGHKAGSTDHLVQIVADDGGELSSLYGMVNETKGSKPNTAYIIDPRKTVRYVLPYPSTVSTRLYQILRFIDENNGHLDGMNHKQFELNSHGEGTIYKPDDGGSFDVVGASITATSTAETLQNTDFADISSAVTTIAGAAAGNYIENALSVLESITEVGKVVPFIAPAFVILKVIISVEQRARDVDAKCQDLVQRVTFMLSHLPALKDIKVGDSTRQVIDHMNDILKKCASLIEAYRKQSAVARRLSMHNKERFAGLAESLKDCTNDLMVSLQIHQSTRLDILTRNIPNDPEDDAAQKFIATHGGMDVIKNDEGLVKQFAGQLKLEVDDRVMEQLNVNIVDVMQENQRQLERTLNESVSASVIDGLKGLAEKMNELEKEQTFKCVQCEKEYKESANGDKTCSFHKMEYDGFYKVYRCCGTKNPCGVGRHRDKHHSDYPYGPFFTWVRNIVWYGDTRENWVEIEDTNLETGSEESASISQLLRWQTRGGRVEEPTILLQVGERGLDKQYFFTGYTAKDLAVITKVVDITHELIIFRNSAKEDEFSMAEWIINSEGIITGVRLTVKVATSSTPFVSECPLDISTCTKSGDVVTVSEGGLRSFKPASPYTLPETKRVCDIIEYKTPRAVRTDFKTRTSPNLPLALKPVSDPPLGSNTRYSHYAEDRFEGSISVFNKHPSGSNNSISISSVTAFYRLLGDEEYKPARPVELPMIVLPFTVDPRQTTTVQFTVNVPRSEEDAKAELTWLNRAFMARRRPLRLKLVLTDVDDEECSIVMEYICPQYRLSQPEKDDIGFFYIDDARMWVRHTISVAKKDDGSIQIGNRTFNMIYMQKIVYKALQSQESEVDLEFGEKKDPGTLNEWEWKAWALVDLSCRRIYAFKVLVTKGVKDGKGLACLGYVLNPPYGSVIDEERPALHAIEKVTFPDLRPTQTEQEVWDDKFDDFVPDPPKPAENQPQAAAAASIPPAVMGPSSVRLALPAELNKRMESMEKHMESMDSSLARIATVMEQLLTMKRSAPYTRR